MLSANLPDCLLLTNATASPDDLLFSLATSLPLKFGLAAALDAAAALAGAMSFTLRILSLSPEDFLASYTLVTLPPSLKHCILGNLVKPSMVYPIG